MFLVIIQYMEWKHAPPTQQHERGFSLELRVSPLRLIQTQKGRLYIRLRHIEILLCFIVILIQFKIHKASCSICSSSSLISVIFAGSEAIVYKLLHVQHRYVQVKDVHNKMKCTAITL